MKIKETVTSDDDGMTIIIEIDDKGVFTAHDGEPEDNTLGRNFNDCLKIVELLKQAYEAGKRGEAFDLEQTGD